MSRRAPLLILLLTLAAATGAPGATIADAADPSDETLLLRTPSLSEEAIAFVYAGDVWTAGREGGEARRLTVHPGVEAGPVFSPDGEWIAFTGEWDGNSDVYLVSVRGGTPRRLTFHPGRDRVRGWTPAGEVLFASDRDQPNYQSKLYTVAREGGFPRPLPVPEGYWASYSPDGKRLAYTPVVEGFATWKRYRGGQTPPIWLFDLASHEVEEVPHENASDTLPVWLGDRVYFLSDRNGPMNVFVYETGTRQVRQVTRHTDYDVRSLAGRGAELVYEQAGRLHLLDAASGRSRPLPLRVAPDLPATRAHFAKAEPLTAAGISPTGVRAVVAARGEILTIPAKKGDVRNLTNTPGVHERDPAWSPDGQKIAYLSDDGGQYRLKIADQKGLGEVETIALDLPGDGPTFYHSPEWSPDGKKIVYTDKRLNLFVVELAKKKPVRIDTDTYDHPQRSLDPAWSPDSRFLAYTKRLDNHLRAVFLYDVEKGTAHQVTDGKSDATSAVFGRDGKHLFFAASTNYGLNTGWLDMSSFERPVQRSLYLAVLAKGEPSPLAPESDEEAGAQGVDKKEGEAGKDGAAKGDEEKKAEPEAPPVQIDLDKLDQRILALPVPPGDYFDLQTAADGKLFYAESVRGPEPGARLHRFDMKERKAALFLEGIAGYWVSQDGKKLLYAGAQRGPARMAGIVDAGAEKAALGDGKIALDALRVWVDPRQEWAQMFDEAWRIERDYFYDPGMHGVDWPGMREKYRPFLAHVGHRADLTYLFSEMLSELSAGHVYIWGGDMPASEAVKVGLLGADFRVEDGRYRFQRILSGENWNPDLRAPLTEPGVDVAAGDYLLAVDGRQLAAETNLYSLFVGTAGRQTVLTVGPKPDGKGSRTVTVVPIEDETSLRHRAWVEANRRRVDEATGGRVAYVYLPDTSNDGYSSFTRYYYSQLDHQAAIIDERFNGGGSVADYIIDMLNRPLLSYWATREGKVFTSPAASIFGPKVMIINQYAGSGGDALPYFFRQRKLGKLVGKRTWGGLIGIYDYPVLMDGGYVTAPRLAFYNVLGKWAVENEGVAPDVEVEMTPKLVIEGRDPQLEKAIEVVLEELEKNPVQRAERPPYPDKSWKVEATAGEQPAGGGASQRP